MGVLAEDSLHRGLLYRTVRCVARHVPVVTCEGFCTPEALFLCHYSLDIIASFIVLV